MNSWKLFILIAFTTSFCLHTKAETLSDEQFLQQHGLISPIRKLNEYNKIGFETDYYMLRGLRSEDDKLVILLGETHVHNQEGFDAGSEFIHHFKHRILEGIPDDEVEQFGLTELVRELRENNYYRSEQLPSLLTPALNQIGAISPGYHGRYLIGLGHSRSGDNNFKCFTSEQWIQMLYASSSNNIHWLHSILKDIDECKSDYSSSFAKKFKTPDLHKFKFINHWMEDDFCIRNGGDYELYLVGKRNRRAVHNIKKVIADFPDQQIFLVITGKDHLWGIYMRLQEKRLFRDVNLDHPDDRVIIKTDFGYKKMPRQ
ncbi:hypothetical protein [Endozoicomonas euniceicola]|uniref:Haem-binding uptake Tiki superfamily ChaN domain-containing protein n=1 Tax=Endozoicomonas euniceicola TaxID=1234143 RepID=A0ABY6GTH9_9GAMM|nr:hypothetical protein [Endozoicomonas euniceicola]UYM15289.1 hypothetical protein NX720_20905 [Endozoicomonas euniceicola]